MVHFLVFESYFSSKWGHQLSTGRQILNCRARLKAPSPNRLWCCSCETHQFQISSNFFAPQNKSGWSGETYMLCVVWSVFPLHFATLKLYPFIFLSLSYDLKLKLKRSWGLQEGSCFAFLSWSPGRLDIWWSRRNVSTSKFHCILTEHPAEDDGDMPLCFSCLWRAIPGIQQICCGVRKRGCFPRNNEKGMLFKEQWLTTLVF